MGRYLLIVCAFAWLGGCGENPVESERRTDEVTGLRYLGGSAEAAFDRAMVPREMIFPEDHGPHPSFQTEWWYFTGNVEAREGRHFGFELTFFRYALKPETPRAAGESAWRAQQTWMAHLAVTDTAGRRFTAVERLARESLGLAGAAPGRLEVWVRDWSARSDGRADLAITLEAQDEAVGLRLELSALAAPVTHGERGLDRKGPSAGNASYYYSVPRLATKGTIRVGEEEFGVEGLAWLDREWSTSALEGGVIGWDWFALQLSNGSSLMYYRLREKEGGVSRFSGGSWVGRDGARVALGASDVQLTPVRVWTSAATGVRYPVAWRLEAPTVGLSLEIRPFLDDQEVDLTVRYWEGAVAAEGVGPEGRVRAQGYLELAGY